MPKSSSYRYLCIAALLALGLTSGCSDGSRTAVSGAAIKGPISGAEVAVYSLDPQADDGRGERIDTGHTNAQAALTDLAIPVSTRGLLLFEFRFGEDATDLTTGASPRIRTLTTVVPAEAIIDSQRRVFATPLTTMVSEIALTNAGKREFGGNDDDTVDEGEMRAALSAGATRVKSLFGYGLLNNIDPTSDSPVLLSDVTDTPEQQQTVARHRTAIEATGCVAARAAEAIDEANNGATSTTTDALFRTLGRDAADGAIDGTGPDGALEAYGDNGLEAALQALTDPVGNCELPDDPRGRTVADTPDILVEETADTGNADAASDAVTEADTRTAGGRATSDIDGDGVADSNDDDIDGDGIPNTEDDAPLVPAPGTPAPNTPPATADDTATVAEDETVVIDVLANDADVDGSLQPDTVTVTSQPASGSLSVNGSTGAITYTPEQDFNGDDSFRYTVADDTGEISAARVAVSVTPVVDISGFNAVDADKPKTLELSWNTDDDPFDHFVLEVNPDGMSGYTAVDRNGDGTIDTDDRIDASATSLGIALPLHLTDFDEARYRLSARDSEGDEVAASSEIGLLDITVESLIGYVKASNSDDGDWFGEHVALSSDGNTLAVSASYERSNATGINNDGSNNSLEQAGAIYVFARDDSGNWSQQAYVKASNTDEYDDFGTSVALSGDGDTLAVGAPDERSNASGINGDQDNDDAPGAGAVYVFTRDGSDTWSQQAYVKASNTDDSDGFGTSVALSDNGSTLAVGASGEASDATGINNDEGNNNALEAGSVYVFSRNSSDAWSQQAYVKASNTDDSDRFGASVALSGDGDTLGVGAWGEASNATGINGDEDNNDASSAGAVYIFTRNSSDIWSQQAYIKASNTDRSDLFSRSVALSGNGDTLAVGASDEASNTTGINGDEDNNDAASAGAAYVFSRDSSGTWTKQAYIKAFNSDVADLFGKSVTLSSNGNILAVGAYLEESNATGVNGDALDNSASDAGAVYVFARDGNRDWSRKAYVKASNTDGPEDRFGGSVALSAAADTLAVGAAFEASNATGIDGDESNDSLSRAGAVYLY